MGQIFVAILARICSKEE